MLDTCLLYTSDAADEEDSVDLGGRRIIKKKIKKRNPYAQDLKLPKYKQRIVRSKKTYTRKGNKKVI